MLLRFFSMAQPMGVQSNLMVMQSMVMQEHGTALLQSSTSSGFIQQHLAQLSVQRPHPVCIVSLRRTWDSESKLQRSCRFTMNLTSKLTNHTHTDTRTHSSRSTRTCPWNRKFHVPPRGAEEWKSRNVDSQGRTCTDYRPPNFDHFSDHRSFQTSYLAPPPLNRQHCEKNNKSRNEAPGPSAEADSRFHEHSMARHALAGKKSGSHVLC